MPVINIVFDEKINNRVIEDEPLEASAFIEVKSHKAKGKRLTTYGVKKIVMLDPIPYEAEASDMQESNGLQDEEINGTGENEDDIEFPAREKKDLPDDDAIQMALEF